MMLDREQLQRVLDGVFARQDMEDVCKRRDIGGIIRILGKYGVTQGQIASLTGIAQGRISEYKTGKRVPSAKSTFEAIANGLGMPAHLRRALGLAPLSGTDGLQAAKGGTEIPTDTFDLQLLAEAIGKRGEALKRRELLELAGRIGAATTIAQNEVWEKVSFALTRPSALDESIIREMEARSTGFHRLEEVLPAQIIYKALAAHIREMGIILNGTTADPKDELRTRLIIAAGESSVLAGWIASDMGSMPTARHFYDIAEKAAREANDPSIVACAYGYRSYIPSGKGAHGRARALLNNALELVSIDDSPGTLAWLAARHAEESAALDDKATALNSWAQAEEAFALTDPDEDRVWTRFLDQDRFDSFHIATFSKIGKLDEAEELARQVIARLPEVDRKRAGIILGDIATAHILQGSITEAAKLAREGLAVTRETESVIWLPKFEEIGKSIARWDRQQPIREFLEDLAMTKRQFGSSPR